MEQYTREHFFPFDEGLRREWLAVNGLGGYASLALHGARSRYYHGLLVASLAPPVRRFLLLANLWEQVLLEDGKHALALYRKQHRDETNALRYLHSLELEPVPCYRYRFGTAILEKTILPVYGSNAVLIRYRWFGDNPIVLELEPLCCFRDFHGLETRARPPIRFTADQNSLTVSLAELGSYRLRLEQGSYHSYSRPRVEEGFLYLKEQERGFQALEDIPVPGVFRGSMEGNGSLVFAAWYGNAVPDPDFDTALEKETARQRTLVERARPRSEAGRRLVLAADKFLVRRQSTGRMSVLAGFPWFSDWGRDTMIALRGLTLCCGREAEALEILRTFAASVRHGLLPNRFSDYEGDEAEYNTADASLWFFIGVRDYLEQSGDIRSVQEHLFPVMDHILETHRQGTIFNISMDPEDGLLQAGEEGTQLTWMDAKMDDIVFTPRHGKAVEINALWYNALRIRDEIGATLGQEPLYTALAEQVLDSFRTRYWNKGEGCLYDVLDGKRRDPAIRPNQLFAICLPYPLLENEQAEMVFHKVTDHLLTPYGLRSLAPGDTRFKPVFEGDRFSRDSAYHQGTVWSWLIGPYAFSWLRLRGNSAAEKEKLRILLQPLLNHLEQDGIGCVSENFDGLFPAEGKGCFHQAWSVAELLRVLQAIGE